MQAESLNGVGISLHEERYDSFREQASREYSDVVIASVFAFQPRQAVHVDDFVFGVIRSGLRSGSRFFAGGCFTL